VEEGRHHIHRLEEEIAVRKKAEEKCSIVTIRWKQLLEEERAERRKQVDDYKMEIMRLELLLKEEGAKRHKLVGDKYSDIKVGFSFAHWT
jgi:hypothetical protein